ncbi:hypothetical protein NQ314_005390 [Rhamnusium bicolor]|uniref:CHK kinase-like domain-containing protein n=1 Tax=Rhamnusium bicolor TaxID=1586634 RepID=A0AAV8ZJY0_9CUCU|nr:hypothetical protein NQ314_005390 [Rhamnusium bicolor]
MSEETIENLEDLIKLHVGSNKKILGSATSLLTAPGDNYGGILLKVDITLENEENDTQEEINAVAKLIPGSEFMQQVLNTQVTCKKEIAFYEEIVPMLQEFQKEQGVDEIIDTFPKFYGARINLNGSDTVDRNAVLMLENLVPSEKILPYLVDQFPHGGETPRLIQLLILEFLEDCEECQTLMPTLRQIIERPRHEKPEERKEPFLTIAHGDMWVNNIMVKFEKGEPVGSKFVDFQNIAFRSPAVDLFLFLWSSVQISVLEENLDDLIKFYHENLIENLSQLKCDCEPFSLESLLEELNISAKYGIPHALFMITFVVFGKKGGFSIDQTSSKMPDFGTKEDITSEAKEKVLFMLTQCNERGWLY